MVGRKIIVNPCDKERRATHEYASSARIPVLTIIPLLTQKHNGHHVSVSLHHPRI